MPAPILDQNGVPMSPDRPSTNLIGSILVTLLCCPPFGIVAIVYGMRVISRFNADDIAGAKHASDMSERWMYAAVGAAILLAIGRVAYYFMARLGGH